MKLAKYLLIPWFSLALYTALSVYNGPAGFVQYRELLTERDKILENLYHIQTINIDLRGNMDALLYDSETIRVKARELGYGDSAEHFVRIVGLPGGRPAELRPGMIRTAVPAFSAANSVWAAQLLISFCVGLLLFSLFLVFDLLVKKKPSDRQIL